MSFFLGPLKKEPRTVEANPSKVTVCRQLKSLLNFKAEGLSALHGNRMSQTGQSSSLGGGGMARGGRGLLHVHVCAHAQSWQKWKARSPPGRGAALVLPSPFPRSHLLPAPGSGAFLMCARPGWLL